MYQYLVIFFLVLSANKVCACTGILLKAKDQKIVSGRTVEFGTNLEMSVMLIPRKVQCKTTVSNGMKYTSKYAAAGVYCFDSEILMDGMNEKGLVAGAFWFPGYAKYTPLTSKNRDRALSSVDFINWVLTQFSSLDELEDALDSVIIVDTPVEGWGPSAPPMHFVVYDKSGRSIVIEPIDGKLVIYDNEIGTITNSPTFDWHLTNLRNYINLKPYNAETIQLRGVKLASFGQGSGMTGLPGDFTPPSRFVRAALFSSYVLPLSSSDGLVSQAFHVLNQFDIPKGSVREKSGDKVSVDYTMLTSVKDPNQMRYYYKSYDDQSIKFLDLKHFDLNGKTIKWMKIQGIEKGIDVSNQLD